jgi:tetratricopeptide (TPR) repeat protein
MNRSAALVRASSALALMLATAAPVLAFKDVGPSSAACDRFERGSESWAKCVGKATTAQSDAELFYAGYWLARAGRYEEALGYLARAKAPDERVLTYIGFATRKLGRVDEALTYYNRALAINPGYSVARAYLGEAYLTLGQPEEARRQLDEIAARSGRSSAEYADLADALARFDPAARPRI